ncbi:MAG: DUF262 domain-containing protein, partial [Alphaproteobacteria bacterium]|nr:DUF262 domain-containing protein [Alphaproteobacteria bacterium]
MSDDGQLLELEVETVEDELSVVDEAEAEQEPSRVFQISSYGADYTVEVLVNRVRAENFFAPPFQRSYVWTQKQASRFIESILLGLPIPSLFFFKQKGSGKHLIVDGQQRLKTLRFFHDGVFLEGTNKDKAFRLTEVQAPWNGNTFVELSEADQLRLKDTVIHTIIFQQEKPEENDDSVYEVFERLNTGGLKLSPQEIRVCVNYGEFAKLLKSANDDGHWRKIYGAPSPRLKDQELILRFIALRSNLKGYKRPMKTFLNSFVEKNEDPPPEWRESVDRLFRETIGEAYRLLGERAFRPGKQLNAAVFDSVMNAIAENLSQKSAPDPENFRAAYNR